MESLYKLPQWGDSWNMFYWSRGDHAGFLGIYINYIDNGKLELSQTSPFGIIISALVINYETTTTCSEPTATKTLAKDENGAPRK